VDKGSTFYFTIPNDSRLNNWISKVLIYKGMESTIHLD
jgi:hypothetical protein